MAKTPKKKPTAQTRGELLKELKALIDHLNFCYVPAEQREEVNALLERLISL